MYTRLASVPALGLALPPLLSNTGSGWLDGKAHTATMTYSAQ